LLSTLGDQIDKREEKTARFEALGDLTEFQLQAKQDLEFMKRDSEFGDANFTERVEQTFTNSVNSFVSNVPVGLQDEFRFRAQQMRAGLVGDAFTFHMKAQDAFFQQGVSDTFNTAKISINDDPSRYEVEKAKVLAQIDTAGLPELVKVQLARDVVIGLQAVLYKAESRTDYNTWTKIGGGIPGSSLDVAAQMLRDFEGYQSGTYFDVNAERVGYGSDTITLPDGTIRRVKRGDTITRANAEKDLKRRVNEEAVENKKLVGSMWDKLPPNVQAGLISVAYNYGSLSKTKSVLSAAKSGDIVAIADAVEALKNDNNSINKTRRLKEAEIIRGGGFVSSEDPRFAGMPFELRQTLRADGEREAARANSQELRQQTQARNLAINELNVGLLDGAAGQADIDSLRSRGVLTEFNDIKKAQDILRSATENANLIIEGAQKIISGGVFDPTDTRDKKMLNAIVGVDKGLEKLGQGDEEFFAGTVLPLVASTRDIPTDVIGTLRGMARSTDIARVMFAYDALSQLQDASPQAFDHRTPEQLARDVDFFRVASNFMTQEQMLERLGPGLDQGIRQGQEVLRKEARDILGKTNRGVDEVERLVQEFIGEFDPFFGAAPTLSGLPAASKGLARDYQTIFIEEYARTGNVELAEGLASRALKRVWGVAELGGSKVLMRFPPSKAGYKEINGSYEWMADNVRETFEIEPEKNVQLLSDEQTRREINEGLLPSYIVSVFDEGAWTIMTDESGIVRSAVRMTQEQVDGIDKEFNIGQAEEQLKRASARLRQDRVDKLIQGVSMEGDLALVEDVEEKQRVLQNLLQRPKVITEPSKVIAQ